MKRLTIPLPRLALIIGTRAMASAGLALLLADRLDKKQRHAVGWTLIGVGIATTLPLLAETLAENRDNPQ